MWRLALSADAAFVDTYAQALEPLASVVSIYEVEPDPKVAIRKQPEDWATDIALAGLCMVEALFEVPPLTEDLTAVLADMSAALGRPLPPLAWDRIESEDWVGLSQAQHPAIRAGAIAVLPAHVEHAPSAPITLRLEASRAFGTGNHNTTYGCLMALQRIRSAPQRVADIGTGTGLLAMAAARLWPSADVVATEIDPQALEVAEHNLRANGIRATCLVADGWRHPKLRRGIGFDLIVQNLLYRPLLRLSTETVCQLRPGGRLVVAGLLGGQERRLRQRLAGLGLELERRSSDPEWPCLTLHKPIASRPGRSLTRNPCHPLRGG